MIRHAGDAGHFWLSIHEVFYDTDGMPVAVSKDPILPYGETADELLEDLIHMQAAAAKPTLDYVLFLNRG